MQPCCSFLNPKMPTILFSKKLSIVMDNEKLKAAMKRDTINLLIEFRFEIFE